MNTASARMFVYAESDRAWVRIVGRANFTSSIDFRTLLSELGQKGCRHFLLDLSECSLMDSTFLGVLAGFGMKMVVSGPAGNVPGIELFNPNPRVRELLESLGVLHLFRVLTAEAPCPMPAGQASASDMEHSKAELAEVCLRSHELLMGLNPANVAKFKELTAFLAEDLKRLRDSSPGGA